jgi:cytochrome c oxidase cbb3-type subunit 4
MDLTDLRIAATVISFLVFLGILWWAYAGSQRSHFAEAERIPFEEDDAPGSARVLPFRAGQSASAGDPQERRA